MRFYTTQSALRYVAITLFSIILASCGQGDGPTKIEDPLFAGGSTAPPVVVVPPSLNLPVKVSFEDAGAVSFGNFGGGVASIIDNPVPTPAARPNTSAKVGQMVKDGGDTFGGSTLTLDEAFDFSGSEILTINVWASRAVPLTFKLEGASDAEDREVVVTHSGSSAWEELVVDFTGMSPPATTMVTLIFDNGSVGDASGQPAFWTFYFDDIAGGVGSGGGELITNGTFESGVSGWVFDPTVNSTFVATTDQSTGPGSSSGNLKADGAGSFPTIQQANLAIGTVMPNQAITVSFDLCGAVEGAGGVFFAQLFSDPAIGSGLPSELQFVGGGPLFPTDQWQQYTLTTLTGANVEGGVSLLFKTDCGGNTGCVVNAYIDNVSLTLDSDTGNVSGAGGACPIDTGGGGGGGGGADVPVPFSTVVYDDAYADIWEGLVCCGSAAVTEETAADTAFGQVVQVDYTGGNTIAGLKYGPGAELLDASAFEASGTLEFDALVTRAGNGEWKLKLEGATGGDFVEVPFSDSNEGVAPVEGVWQHYTFDIASALSGGSLKWNEVKLVLFFSDFGNGLGQIQVDNVGFRPGTGGGGGGGGPSGTATIDFESGGVGADFNWITFENGDDPPLEVISNPVPGVGNMSATVGAYTARSMGQPFAGVESGPGDFGGYVIDASTRYVKLWVYKTVISDVGMQLTVGAAARPAVRVANTVTNQWEQLTFDFNELIGFGEWALGDITKIVIFPDWNDAGRVENTIYIDNISFESSP